MYLLRKLGMEQIPDDERNGNFIQNYFRNWYNSNTIGQSPVDGMRALIEEFNLGNADEHINNHQGYDSELFFEALGGIYMGMEETGCQYLQWLFPFTLEKVTGTVCTVCGHDNSMLLRKRQKMVTLQVALPPARRGIQDSLGELMLREMTGNDAQMIKCSNDHCTSRMQKKINKVLVDPFSNGLIVKLKRRVYQEGAIAFPQQQVPEFTDRRRVSMDYSVELPAYHAGHFFNQKYDLIGALEHTAGGDLESEKTQNHSGHWISHLLHENTFVTVDDNKSLKCSPIEKLSSMFIFKKNDDNDHIFA